jgi:sulfatase modifying factor 1
VRKYPLLLALIIAVFYSCKQNKQAVAGNSKTPVTVGFTKKELCCESNIPKRFAALTTGNAVMPGLKANASHKGMVWIKPGTFMMGGDNSQAADDEYPKHKVTVDGFWMDVTTVTNAQFAEFVKATGYITTAERKPDWNELKKQLPPAGVRPS